MLEKIPDDAELPAMMGDAAFGSWQSISNFISEKYVMETLWNSGGKAGPYECKFRKGGKTLCCLYPGDHTFGFMVIFGAAEREVFDQIRGEFSPEVLAAYDAAVTYHDGKWVMISVTDDSLIADMQRMLLLKRKPNRKQQ